MSQKFNDKLQERRKRLGMGFAAGNQMGAEAFLKYFEMYRMFMGPFFLLLGVIFIFFGAFIYALICLCAMHFTVFCNQIWWKLQNIEKLREEK